HVADWLLDIQPDSDRCGHRLVDQVDLAGAGVLCRIPNSALFDFGNAARHADHHPPDGRYPAFLDLADEAADEHLGDLEIRDYAVLEGADGLDLAVCALVHL